MRQNMRKIQMRRREALTCLAGAGSVLVLAGCGSGGSSLRCVSELTPAQRTARDGRQYVEVSKVAGQSCSNCTFFASGGAGCGTCGIDNLPANPEGYCISWVAMPAGADDQAEG